MPDSHPDVVVLVPSAPSPKRSPAVALGLYLLGSIPTLVILAGIGAVGWYGHHHDWTLPKFSELRGEIPEADDWCKEHNVPESICVECDETRMPRRPAAGWCKTHATTECVWCNPQLAELANPPTVSPAELDRIAKTLATSTEVSKECQKHQRRFQFPSDEDREKAGIDFAPVGTATVAEWVLAVGELGFDQTRVAHLSVRSPGSVTKVFKRLGQTVKTGEVLALVETPEVGKAKVEILQAFGTLQLKQQALAALRTSDVTAPARIREAEGAVREAELRLAGGCQALTNLGLPFEETETAGLTAEQLKSKLQFRGIPAEVVATLDRKTTANLLPLFAPMEGLVTSRDVVAGEVVDPAKTLFELADTSTLWLTLDVKGEDADRVAVGRTVKFTPDHTTAEVTATILWRSTQVDPKTRTLKVRAEVANPEGRLLTNTYGMGRIIMREKEKILAVPPEAVQWEGCCYVVFVKDRDYDRPDRPKVLHTRKVRVGARDGGNFAVQFPSTRENPAAVEIVVGLLPGEVVVTKGSAALAAELRRDDLGDGCCGGHKKDKD